MSRVLAVSIDYDGGTKRHGASAMTYLWHQMLQDLQSPAEQLNLPRQMGAMLPKLAETVIRDAARHGRRPLALGGDHSLSWHCLRPLTEHYGHLAVVHFDAHHDAYPSHVLNHYTVFHHVGRLLPTTIHRVGIRHDGHAPDRLQQAITGPCYLSIDIDYFSTALVKNVVHAVAPLEGQTCDLASFRASLDQIKGPVIGADIVEWMGSDRGTPEYELVREVVADVHSILDGTDE